MKSSIILGYKMNILCCVFNVGICMYYVLRTHLSVGIIECSKMSNQVCVIKVYQYKNVSACGWIILMRTDILLELSLMESDNLIMRANTIYKIVSAKDSIRVLKRLRIWTRLESKLQEYFERLRRIYQSLKLL